MVSELALCWMKMNQKNGIEKPAKIRSMFNTLKQRLNVESTIGFSTVDQRLISCWRGASCKVMRAVVVTLSSTGLATYIPTRLLAAVR